MTSTVTVVVFGLLQSNLLGVTILLAIPQLSFNSESTLSAVIVFDLLGGIDMLMFLHLIFGGLLSNIYKVEKQVSFNPVESVTYKNTCLEGISSQP